ncbi:MAG: hypothetical protein J6386_02190 [Candidatus Synoicihabitans palmerolidicus]|nr:hypothetical protein [Candidatus Synoicihabitans palmerolidicus]
MESTTTSSHPPSPVTTTRPGPRPPTSSAAPTNVSPERIAELSHQLARNLKTSSSEIEAINLQTNLLSMNARIEAARAGAAGNSFGVVTGEMIQLSSRTSSVSQGLQRAAAATVDELIQISGALATEVRGKRLANLALTNIDLIDRNLYERSCDVRWWATDSAVVEALAQPSNQASAHASQRLGIIFRCLHRLLRYRAARSPRHRRRQRSTPQLSIHRSNPRQRGMVQIHLPRFQWQRVRRCRALEIFPREQRNCPRLLLPGLRKRRRPRQKTRRVGDSFSLGRVDRNHRACHPGGCCPIRPQPEPASSLRTAAC